MVKIVLANGNVIGFADHRALPVSVEVTGSGALLVKSSSGRVLLAYAIGEWRSYDAQGLDLVAPLYDVEIVKIPPNKKIQAIKNVRRTMSLPLQDAKNFLDNITQPLIVATGVSAVVADKIKTIFEADGILVSIQPKV